MGWESDQEAVEIKADRSRWIILGIVGMVIAMIVVLIATNDVTRTESSVHVAHILKVFPKDDPEARQKAWNEIVEMKRLIDEGADFGEMARQHSDDDSNSERGGNLGWVGHDDLVEAFENYIWTAEVGSVSDPVETPFGFHLILIKERVISDAELYDRNLNQRVLELDQKQE